MKTTKDDLDRKLANKPGRLSEEAWKSLLLSTPIPCVDIIVEKQSMILLGFRVTAPYRNVWALPGGRILKNEHPEETVKRILEEINVQAEIRHLTGVFPKRFPQHPQKRYDIVLCYKTEWTAGEPEPDDELTRFKWCPPKNLPAPTGGNYRKMIREAYG